MGAKKEWGQVLVINSPKINYATITIGFIKKGYKMYAIEFETYIDNGIVHIPKEIDGFNQIKKAKFIMMYDNDDVVRINFLRDEEDQLKIINPFI